MQESEPVNVVGYIRELEAALQRYWITEDYIRTWNRVSQVYSNEVALGDQIEQELVHLLGDNRSNYSLVRDILLDYYRWLLQAMRSMEEYNIVQQNHMVDSTTSLDEVIILFTFDELSILDPEEEDEDEDGFVDFPSSRSQQEHDGLSEETILSHLKTRDGDKVVGEDEDAETCCVNCQEDLDQQGKKIATLDCSHEYHADCIVEWLRRGTNICPLCKQVAVCK